MSNEAKRMTGEELAAVQARVIALDFPPDSYCTTHGVECEQSGEVYATFERLLAHIEALEADLRLAHIALNEAQSAIDEANAALNDDINAMLRRERDRDHA